MRIGIDVGGTNTDAVLLDAHGDIVASVKRPTSDDIETGVVAALHAVLDGHDPGTVELAMLGTTQCTNAVVERRGLRRVGVLRIGAPATTAVPPLADWPDDLREAVLADARVIRGGHHYDGREISPLDLDAVRAAARDWAGRVEAVAVTGVFSPANPEHEKRAAALLAELVTVPVSVSHEVGSMGLLERENATVLNAALTGVARRATGGFVRALAAAGVPATGYLSQNDGTLMTMRQAVDYPVRTVASGPTNSLRGGALLSGRQDAVVIDVGGTTADFGALGGGFPRESGVAVDVGGVVTNFRMPDLVSIGIGGGTVVRGTGRDARLGPDSVGHEITHRALCFGGDTLTLTDVAVAAGFDLGDGAAVRARLDGAAATATLEVAEHQLTVALDRIRTSAEPVTVIAVGGGSFLVPDRLTGAAEVLRPAHHEVANAVGAAIAEVSGEVDRVFRLDGAAREEVVERARSQAHARAVAAGADPDTVREIDFEEIQLAYLPGNAVRIRARAAGRLRGTGGRS
ncbi:hydantoinase/oxoprolinase N-terminal domain-containing protein [Plantactinospora sp. GCM10030261]|uniref:hydantoinase/oxoprolinase N-terminal domain-containing protein n=1 Tax=Plantactinospora sp. GCM10030261 TaxID=3273420 RepID=UPI00361384DD